MSIITSPKRLLGEGILYLRKQILKSKPCNYNFSDPISESRQTQLFYQKQKT